MAGFDKVSQSVVQTFDADVYFFDFHVITAQIWISTVWPSSSVILSCRISSAGHRPDLGGPGRRHHPDNAGAGAVPPAQHPYRRGPGTGADPGHDVLGDAAADRRRRGVGAGPRGLRCRGFWCM